VRAAEKAAIIMVTLKNIKISPDTAEADYSPEDSNWWGHIVVDLKSWKIISCDRHPEYRNIYLAHAVSGLLELSKMDKIPEKWVIMWC
jgi:hypothetical protein